MNKVSRIAYHRVRISIICIHTRWYDNNRCRWLCFVVAGGGAGQNVGGMRRRRVSVSRRRQIDQRQPADRPPADVCRAPRAGRSTTTRHRHRRRPSAPPTLGRLSATGWRIHCSAINDAGASMTASWGFNICKPLYACSRLRLWRWRHSNLLACGD